MHGLFNNRRLIAAQALLWEFCRRGWWRLLVAQFAVLSVALIVYSALWRAGPLDPAAGGGVHVVLVAILFVATSGAALAAQGDPRRFYLLPLSNWGLAAVTMLPGCIAVAATYFIAAVVLNAWYDASWPVWGTAFCFAAAFAAIRAAAQTAGSGRLARFLAWCCVGVPLTNWWRARFGGGWFLAPEAMWLTVTWTEGLSIAVVMFSALLVMAQGIARERRGDLAWCSLRPTWLVLPSRKSRLSFPQFRSNRSAQFWFEWKQKGLILPATLAAFTGFLVTGCVFGVFENRAYELLHGLLGYGIVLAPMTLIAGLVLGHVDLPQANSECGTLLGTRPMTSAGLAEALFKVEAASLLLTWGLWTAATFGATALLSVDQGAAPVLDLWTDHGNFRRQFEVMGPWYAVDLVIVSLLAAWIPLALATSLVLTGRQRWVIGCVVGSVPLLLAGLYLTQLRAEGIVVVPDEVWQIAIGVAAAAATVLTFAWAKGKGLIDWRTCGGALGGWLTLCVLAAGVSWWLRSTEVAYSVFAAGVLALVVAPLASGPLALSWNRHR